VFLRTKNVSFVMSYKEGNVYRYMIQSDQFRFYIKEIKTSFFDFFLQLTTLFQGIEGFEKVIILGFL